MTLKLFFILFAAAAVATMSGCNNTQESNHDMESVEEHESHAHEPSTVQTHEHEEIVVHDESEIAHDAHSDEDAATLIVFPTSLQKSFGIRSEPVRLRDMHQVIRTMGEIKPTVSREAEVVAPFTGTLLPDQDRGIVRPGQRVQKGEHLAMLAPSTDELGGFKLLGDYQLAKAEYERVIELEIQGAAAPRRVQEARIDLRQKEARLRAALGDLDISDLDSTGSVFHLRAPLTGILTDVHLRFGQHVEMGERLFNIVDPSRVWLEAQVLASEIQRLESVKDAYFTIAGSSKLFRTDELDGKVVSVGGIVDPITFRVPVILEIENPQNIFKPGSYVQVYLRETAARNVLSIPESAVLDEDGIPVAMTQVGPEDFRKVVLKTGIRDEDYVEVLSGLDGNDRVVVEGAYKVKVASNQPSTDAHAGHGH
jgi:RND family efflux transporter MFP subunit